ncbi:MAG: thioredoxin-dependent thiol peroxidase [Alphaproteobacteria bacterium]|jgi:thioredoxin-dependent peroxiredoxin|nr:thioredoxin-dependent thiol peroxidase [Alphaproteobacteria bacterium]
MAIDELLNQPVPMCLLHDANGQEFNLESHKGQPIVLYFYPKDNTSGCTKQACDLRDKLDEFKRRNCVVFGISKDGSASHQRFSSKFDLNFPLLSDPTGAFCEAFNVWKQKSMYGKLYFGIERSTFYIDDSFIIRHIWPKVKVPEHWDHVLKTIDSFQQKN